MECKVVFLTNLLILTTWFQTCVAENDVILMENYDPEKGQGWWFVLKRTNMLFDDIKCVKFELHHDDDKMDIYKMVTWWINPNDQYEETLYDIVDDRDHPARFYFASHRDRIAFQVLGTDYENWIITHGVVGPKEAYGLHSRTKTIADEHWRAINEVLEKNQIKLEFMDVEHMDCPDRH